ncbi:MAG: hypothetical protein I3270_02555 [Candidatus Moeniiplasma glomeromycotorum]|nr:hypothetical protein [Candidatus Moeniiplasma glomeromycotorum]MCE8162572.1 hypothetical protein [Candidatus Moeniiplasma glomeromycotorum]MCE8166504.1 hypothetical protein [Candidatus Moeniiplasma glomeromycotorum]MCE8166955.1 hypothetical protein [Candidatus Moeniiplasma glomeromycotorum]
MPTTTLTNPTLKKLTDINQNPYYLLVNPDNQDEAYFCFPKTVVAGWSELEQAAEQNTSLSQVTLEYQESEKGMRIYKQVVRVEIN